MKPKSIKHLLRRQDDELGHVTRYFAPCGYSGVTKRDFSPNISRKNSRGEIVPVVTCKKCLGLYAMTIYYVPKKGKKNVDQERMSGG